MNSGYENLSTSIADALENYASCAAIEEKDDIWTYRDLTAAITHLSALIHNSEQKNKKVGILATRSAVAYASVLACVKMRAPFVPLNPAFPDERLASIVAKACPTIVICDGHYAQRLDKFIASESTTRILADWFQDICTKKYIDIPIPDISRKSLDGIAYEMFTSGSTGTPKGVRISYDNLCCYISNIRRLYTLRKEDRCSQVFDLSFDLSMHDIFVSLTSGGCLVPASDFDLLMPANYISKKKLSIWFSVPSLASLVLEQPNIAPSAFGNLRFSLFCGEPLTCSLAERWKSIFRKSNIINLYGPTESTIAVTSYTGLPDTNGPLTATVPIGNIFEDHRAALLVDGEILVVNDEDGINISPSTGELLISGPQVFSGYSHSSEPAPFTRDKSGANYYRTGDLVQWTGTHLVFKGRLDDQVKIRGFRVELGEIESTLRRYYSCEAIIVVAERQPNTSELVAIFPKSFEDDTLKMPSADSLGLPTYMIPKKIVFADRILTNANGKVDRNKMIEQFC